MATLIADFQAVRAAQLALYLQFAEQSWYDARNVIWG
jgi:hypothetical protein